MRVFLYLQSGSVAQLACSPPSLPLKSGGGAAGGEDKDEDRNKPFDMKRVASLMYHPATVRTPNQRRTQTLLVQMLVREVQRKFNEQVAKLHSMKADEVEKIEARNHRIREITAELKEAPALFEPKLEDDEAPKRFLTVADAEVGFPRYVTAAEKAELEKAEQRKAQAAAAMKDNAPERALQQMMGGTLEVQDDLAKLQQSLVREAWMDELTEDQMSQEQRAQYESYQAKQKALM